MQKITPYIVLIVIFFLGILGTVFFFNYKMDKMRDSIVAENGKKVSNLESSFKILSDGKSVKSEVRVIERPTFVDKLFNTQVNKLYKQLMDSIPASIQKEIKSLKIENKVNNITQATLVLQGDSLYYHNKDGVTTKAVKVVPVNGDSSLLIIVPQNIEITSVVASPDKKNPEKMYLYLSAYNRTTGDSLKFTQATTYQIPKKNKGFSFNTKPYLSAKYNLLDSKFYAGAGIYPINYEGKHFVANFLGAEVGLNSAIKPTVTIEAVRLNLK